MTANFRPLFRVPFVSCTVNGTRSFFIQVLIHAFGLFQKADLDLGFLNTDPDTKSRKYF
jgi:hypothetical protein